MANLAIKISNTTKFFGRPDENWEQWLSRFEARFRDLDTGDRNKALVEVLEGAALDTYAKLDDDVIGDYKKVKAALQKKFGRTVHSREAHAELRSIRQRPGETEEAFGDRIEGLLKIASSDLTKKQRQSQALHHFLCGISDPDLQETLHNRDDIVSLQQAIEISQKCKEKATVLKAMRSSSNGEMAMTARQSCVPISTGEKSKSLGEKLDEIRGEIDSLKGQLHQVTSGRQGTPAVRRCYQCGETTHLIRNCPQKGSLRRNEGTEGRFSAPAQRGGACFHCGDSSHWRRNCPHLRQQRQGMQNSSRRFTATQEKGADPQPFCYGCGASGHWMAACWRIPQTTNQMSSVRGPESTQDTQQNTRQPENV